MVGVGDRLRNPVSDAAVAADAQRSIAARVNNFAAVAPLRVKSDLLATLPATLMVDAAQRFDVVAMPVEIIWLRELLRQVMAEIVTASERLSPS